MEYIIIEKGTNKDVTDKFISKYEKAKNAKTDVEMYKAWGNHPSSIPSDRETKLIMMKNLVEELFERKKDNVLAVQHKVTGEITLGKDGRLYGNICSTH